MKKLIKYLKPYWFFALLAPLAMIGEVAADLFLPKLMSGIVDEGILAGSLENIFRAGITMVIVAAAGGLSGLLCTVFAVRTSQSFGNDLRKDAFARVMALSQGQSDEFSTGSLITRLTNDISATENFISAALRMLIRSLFMFVGGIVMVLSIDRGFAAVLIFVLPLELFIMVVMLKKLNPMYRIVQEKLDRVNSVVQENVAGARVVKSFAREDYEIARFDGANTVLADKNYAVSRLMALVVPLLSIFMNFSVMAIVLIGGFRVEARAINIGSVMAAVTYITQILMGLFGVGMVFQMISRAEASAVRIAQVLDTLPDIKGGPLALRPGRGDIRMEDISFSYQGEGGALVLKNISLHVKTGETVAVIGGTGAGKTTLVSLIPRFYDPTRGKIYIGGEDISECSLESLRGRIGFVLQKSELFSGTIADNIRWGKPGASGEEIRAAADTAQAGEFIERLEDGYDTVIGEKGMSLSGGQRQRLSIARALVRRPDILIFDDSSSALDTGTESRLHGALREEMKGATIIIIAQRITSVKNADRILLLDNGEIAGNGTHDELLATNGLYREIFASQQRMREVNGNG